jgi:FixJ family two-component response regulator
VVLDLAMPSISGIGAAHRLSILNPRVPLILFTLCDIEEIKPIASRAERSSAGQNMQ